MFFSATVVLTFTRFLTVASDIPGRCSTTSRPPFWAYLLTVKRDTEKNCNQISWKLRSLSGESYPLFH